MFQLVLHSICKKNDKNKNSYSHNIKFSIFNKIEILHNFFYLVANYTAEYKI